MTDATIADIRRNYPSFWFVWIEVHPRTGHDYLLCGKDYWGSYSIVDLTTAQVLDQVPVGQHNGDDDRWCWAAVYPSPDGTKLAVEGCWWACPYDVRVYDFIDPTVVPLPKLYDGFDYARGEESVCSIVAGWDDATHLRLSGSSRDPVGEDGQIIKTADDAAYAQDELPSARYRPEEIVVEVR